MEDNTVRAVAVIKMNAVYSLAQFRTTLGLRAGTAAREIRAGRLRSSKRAGKVWVLGSWILQWIEEGERKRPMAQMNCEQRNGVPTNGLRVSGFRSAE